MHGLFDNFFPCLQVISKKDQEQYWSNPDLPYRHVPPAKFVDAFHLFQAGKTLSEELDVPFDKRYNHPAALATTRFGMKRCDLLKTSFKWQVLLMKRNAFIYIFKFIQVIVYYLFIQKIAFHASL